MTEHRSWFKSYPDDVTKTLEPYPEKSLFRVLEESAQRFADMQAESSNDNDRWQETQPTLTARAADPEGKEPFAQRFSEMQAASSNSGEWAYHPGANVPADEANSTLVAGKPISHVVAAQVAASQK